LYLCIFAETNPIFIRDINWLYGRGACWEWGQQMGSMPAKGGWRRSADRTRLPGKFPANREFNREILDFLALETDIKAKKRCAAAVFRSIP
jgi:hypothetical protein